MNNITYVLDDGRKVTFYPHDKMASVVSPCGCHVVHMPKDEAAKLVEAQWINKVGE